MPSNESVDIPVLEHPVASHQRDESQVTKYVRIGFCNARAGSVVLLLVFILVLAIQHLSCHHSELPEL